MTQFTRPGHLDWSQRVISQDGRLMPVFQRFLQQLTGNAETTNTAADDAQETADAAVPQSRLISTTSPLSGGGDLSADLTLSIALLRIIPFFFTSTPTASEILAIYIAVDAFMIPANMSGSRVSVGTNPTATFAIDVQQNGSTIATISIATGGTATLTTTSGAAKSIAAGDVIKFVAPSSADATIANVAINVKGTI